MKKKKEVEGTEIKERKKEKRERVIHVLSFVAVNNFDRGTFLRLVPNI